MIDDVGQLLGEQTNIESVQYASSARRSKVQLEVSSSVPCKCRDATIARDTKLIKNCSDLARALGPLGIGRALKTRTCCSHDGLMTEVFFGPIEKMQNA